MTLALKGVDEDVFLTFKNNNLFSARHQDKCMSDNPHRAG